MSTFLAEAKEQEAAQSERREQSKESAASRAAKVALAEHRAKQGLGALTGAELLRECERVLGLSRRNGAPQIVRAGFIPTASASERESLAGMLTEHCLERYAVRSARGDEWVVPATRIGERYLQRVALAMFRDSREWRDESRDWKQRERKREQDERERESERRKVEVVSLESESLWLSAALTRESIAQSGAELAPLPADRAALAALIAERVTSDESERDNVRAALLCNLPGEDDEIPEGPAVALAEGCSYGALRKRASRGRALLASRYPDSSDLVALVSECGDELGREQAESDREQVSAAALAAGWLVDECKRQAVADVTRSSTVKGGHYSASDKPGELWRSRESRGERESGELLASRERVRALAAERFRRYLLAALCPHSLAASLLALQVRESDRQRWHDSLRSRAVAEALDASESNGWRGMRRNLQGVALLAAERQGESESAEQDES